MAGERVLEGAEAHITQIGIVVKDLEKAIAYFSSLGLGPFSVRTGVHPTATVRGKIVSYEVKIGTSQQGSIELELVEYLKGVTIHEEFLREKGEGLHHIRFRVKDIDAALEKFAEKGIGVLQEDRFVGGGGIAYLDTAKIGGTILELSQPPVKYDPQEGFRYAIRK